jgi:uncharacterized membrane protein YbhN (UPF0104 family)
VTRAQVSIERQEGLPQELETGNLRRRAITIAVILAIAGLVLLLAPGLGDVRSELEGINPWWVALAVVLEALSCASYVLMFRPIFCPHMPWKMSWQISLSEVGVGSIVPASGISGLALGAWVLRRAGMPPDMIAHRSVAFFLIKSSINFVLVAVLGYLLALGLLGPDLSLWLTLFPAVMATLTITAVVLVPRLGHGPDPGSVDGRTPRAMAAARNALVDGAAEAVRLLRSGNWMAIAGSVGYYAWDNAVLWATFKAVGADVPISVVMLGYLIGQLGGLLPLPGGLGGVDGGLIGTLVVFGAPAALTASAVLAYRVILFWLPLIAGAIAFASLRRTLRTIDTGGVCRAAVGSPAVSRGSA